MSEPFRPQNNPNTSWTNPVDAPPPFPQTGMPHATYGQQPLNAPSWGHQPSATRAADADDRTWAILAHLAAPISAVVSVGWLTIAGPLLVWLVKKDSSPFVRNASAGAFNFTLSMWLMGVVGWILTITVIGAIIGIPMIIISALGSIVLGIVGAMKSAAGESYTYPWQIRVLN